MDRDWPYHSQRLGTRVKYTCPTGMVTWENEVREQYLTCAWDRDTDVLGWMPTDVEQYNREYLYFKEQKMMFPFVS